MSQDTPPRDWQREFGSDGEPALDAPRRDECGREPAKAAPENAFDPALDTKLMM